MMNKEEIEAGNKIIAEWMGLEIVGRSFGSITVSGGKAIYYLPDYESDWNCLMEVVEKIESLSKSVYINSNMCSIYEYPIFSIEAGHWFTEKYGYTKVEAVWRACIEFIKFYNENKTSI